MMSVMTRCNEIKCCTVPDTSVIKVMMLVFIFTIIYIYIYIYIYLFNSFKAINVCVSRLAHNYSKDHRVFQRQQRWQGKSERTFSVVVVVTKFKVIFDALIFCLC